MPEKIEAAMRRFERIEYSVITKAAPELAWQVFSDWELWPLFSEFYADIHWTKGEPWQEGSRLSIRTRSPIGVTLDHVIISCVPAEKWGGSTMRSVPLWSNGSILKLNPAGAPLSAPGLSLPVKCHR